MPSWVNADSSWAGPSSYIPVKFTKTIVVLQFKSEATQAERQAAVDSVAGTVIGGYNAAGIYLLQVSDPGDGSGIMRAVEKLEALPNVLGATPNVEFGPH